GDKAILGALLSCCDFYGNSKLAETVAQQIFKSDPSDNVYKVMLSNIYAGDGRWDDAKKLRDKMTGGQKKIRGEKHNWSRNASAVSYACQGIWLKNVLSYLKLKLSGYTVICDNSFLHQAF
ncbi:hypothetical protein L195_g027570, partial [Trifolium pratense]